MPPRLPMSGKLAVRNNDQNISGASSGTRAQIKKTGATLAPGLAAPSRIPVPNSNSNSNSNAQTQTTDLGDEPIAMVKAAVSPPSSNAGETPAVPSVLIIDNLEGSASYKTVDSTPSLDYLVQPDSASSIAFDDNLAGDSVSQAGRYQSKDSYDRIFVFSARDVNIRDEPISCSVEKYHPRYDPNEDKDPLTEFGALNGLMPGRDFAATALLRDAVIRWTTPHRLLVWSDMDSAIDIMRELRPQLTELLAFKEQGGIMYSIGSARLTRFGHLVLAVQQVLDALWTFLGRQRRDSFILDPGFMFLRILERYSSRTRILMDFGILQHRIQVASVHIRRTFNWIKLAYVAGYEGADMESTADSTLESIRSDFGRTPVLHEMAKLLSRPDYGAMADTIDANDRQALIAQAKDEGLVLPQKTYKNEKEGHSYKSPYWPSGVFATTVSPTIAAAIPVPASPETVTENPLKELCFAMPESLSSIGRPHAVSSLPGMGRMGSSQAYSAPSTVVSGGPSLIRQEAFAQGDSLSAVARGREALTGWTSHVFKSGVPPVSAFDSGFLGGNGLPFVPPDGTDPPGGGNGGPPDGKGFPPGGNGIPPSGNGVPPVSSVPPGGGSPGGGPPGGGGGSPGGGPPSGGYVPGQVPSAIPDGKWGWQMNRKLNMSVIPSWNGGGDTAIEYILAMSNLSTLGSELAVDIAAMASQKWSDRALNWWNALPSADRRYLSSGWETLLLGIREHFLDAQWIEARTFEFEEMRFRQKGHTTEEPLDFIQRRIQHHSFLHPEDTDGPLAIARILRTQPIEWIGTLNERTSTSIFEVQATAKHYLQTLLSLWTVSLRSQDFQVTQAPISSFKRYRKANVADADEDEDDAVKATALAADRSWGAKGGQRGGKPPGSKKPWPEGKTVGGYAFTRDDSVSSRNPPNGECFICTSPKHFARDCPHYGRWQVLRSANI